MGRMVEARESEYYDALQSAVREALAPHGPGAASLREEVGGSISWSLDITPVRPGAARAYLTHIGGDEIVLGFGGTHVYMWDDDPQDLARQVELLLTAVFHGRFVEGGPRKDAFAKVETSGGPMSVGRISLPLPWRFRRKRRYASYSA
jgi:hypothetical protein